MKATITERGQVSIPAQLRREMHLEAGQTVIWSKVSASECRLIAIPPKLNKPDPVAALGFAGRHDLGSGSTEAWMKLLRADEED